MKHGGFQMVEAVVAIAVFALAGLALLTAYGAFVASATSSRLEVKAAFLGEEGLEAVRSIRDRSYAANISPLSGAGSHYLYWNPTSGEWSATTTVIVSDGIFYRTVVVSPVYRDASSDIAPEGADDPETKKIAVFVSWGRNEATTTKNFMTYVTDLFNN